MKEVSSEVLAFPLSERMRNMMNPFNSKGVHWIVSSNVCANETGLPASKDVLCGFCMSEKHTQDFIIAGHIVSICSDCLEYLASTWSGPSGDVPQAVRHRGDAGE